MIGIMSVAWNSHASPTTVVAWGENTFGQTNVPAGLTNAMAIAQGGYYCLVLKSDGTMTGWGCNYNPLATNSYLGQATVPTGASNIVAISAGYDCSMILENDGSIMFWGDLGQTNLPDGLTNITMIAAGERHSLVSRNDGALISWGQNFYGETSVPSGLTNAMAIGVGCGFDSIVVRSNGSVVVWGFSWYGETNIPPAATNVVAVASGLYHILALRWDGKVIAWGYNGYGETNVPTGLSNVVAIAAGWDHCLALKRDGTIVAWGENNAGQTTIPSGLSNVVAISASRYQSMALVNDGSPWIAQQPSSQTTYSGMNATFNVLVIGTTNVNYQWRFNGTNVTRATNAFLSLTNAQLTNSGNYSVIVTNAYGSTTGLIATLTVMDLGVAVNATNLVWTTSGSYQWFPETNTNHNGIAAAQSATPPFPQYSTLQSSVTGPGTLTFWAECSQFFDTYIFSASGSYGQTVFIPPFAQWVQETVYLGTGTQSLQWLFQKSPFGSTGLDAVWLDQVSFVAGATHATITSISSNQIVPPATNVTFTVYAVGTPPLSYQWNFNGNILFGATNFSLSLTNVQLTNAGVYSVIVTNAYGTPVTTNATLIVQMPQFDTSPGNMFMSIQGFNFQLDGLTGHGPVIIFASTDLLAWLPIFTNPPTTGAMQVLDTNAVYLPFRFYRAAEQ